MRRISALEGLSLDLCVRGDGPVKALRAEKTKQICCKELAHVTGGGGW